MVSSTTDHMVAMVIFIAALTLFIGLFTQTIQTAMIYQNHRAIATKATELLDTILLNPGSPSDWSRRNSLLTGFGIQDPEFTQYKASSLSLMHLQSATGTPLYFNGQYYSNITMGERNFMLVPYSLGINYSTASQLLGITGKYGFQLTLTPIVTVAIQEVASSYPLTLKITANGIGSVLSYAQISYCLLKVTGGSTPAYEMIINSTTADNTGSVNVNFTGVATSDSFAFIAYASEGGLVGVGCYEREHDNGQYVVPFINNFETREILLAHSCNVQGGQNASVVFYNATYILMSDDFSLRPMDVNSSRVSVVNQTYGLINIPTYNPGILVLPYKSTAGDGIVMMPWGISALGFPVTFGGNPAGQDWVATDFRQVTVGGVAYQAKIAVWSNQGYQVNG